MFLLIPAYPGSPGQKAVKGLCVRVIMLLRHRSKIQAYRMHKIVHNKKTTKMHPMMP